ncbi:uncharacterized protein LOC116257102 [Nymphaea colorata]|uniref:DUF761 domain-containing protein n=1 Tax=Nymphaea colorata TaxID=210225 RepID=A0A5K1F7C3_9MAGN|nr:uncharacterized protein LOC116257102 [Nymphaea colorata]VVW58814.1 unnamed protein product [Nymphaea colorata]
MKIKATKFLKQVWAIMGEALKSKTGAVKSKASALRTRLIVLSLLRNKKFLLSTISHKFQALLRHEKAETGHASSNISHKIHALFGNGKAEAGHISTISHKIHALLGHPKAETGDGSKAIVVYNPILAEMQMEQYCCDDLVDEEDEEEDESDDYPDLTHCLFDSEDLELDNQNLSVVDIVKQSTNSENFVLEEEIDRVADLFIKRFHRQMQMQKQQSFKRYQEMLNQSA